MDIAFRTRKLERDFNRSDALQKSFGARMAKVITMRMAVLRAARNLALVPITPPERRHRLVGNQNAQFAVDLVHPYRLVFEASHQPVPRKGDGGIDTEHVTAITILDVVDYH